MTGICLSSLIAYLVFGPRGEVAKANSFKELTAMTSPVPEKDGGVLTNFSTEIRRIQVEVHAVQPDPETQANSQTMHLIERDAAPPAVLW
jgi:hypothetical protein